MSRGRALEQRSPAIGTNRRYADAIDRRAILKVYAQAMRDGLPSSLKAWETDLEHEPVTIAPAAHQRPVHAWVRYDTIPVRVNAYALRWTEHAVGIEWPVPQGGEHRAWVWVGAVQNGHLIELDWSKL